MEDMCSSLRAPSTLAPAQVARQFAGSRIEGQVLTQVFDVVWQAGRNGTSLTASDSAGADSATRATLATARLSRKGSIS